MSTAVAHAPTQLTMVSNINNLNSTLDYIQKQYNICIDVWNIILKHLIKNKLNGSIDWIINPKIHRDIKRCMRGTRILPYTANGNYGRYMLQMLYPLSFNNNFKNIDIILNSGSINIGGAILNFSDRFRFLEYDYDTTKDKLIDAINMNTNGRKIKKLDSMSKPDVFHTLLKLDEFKLEIDVKNSNKYITRYLA